MRIGDEPACCSSQKFLRRQFACTRYVNQFEVSAPLNLDHPDPLLLLRCDLGRITVDGLGQARPSPRMDNRAFDSVLADRTCSRTQQLCCQSSYIRAFKISSRLMSLAGMAMSSLAHSKLCSFDDRVVCVPAYCTCRFLALMHADSVCVRVRSSIWRDASNLEAQLQASKQLAPILLAIASPAWHKSCGA